MILVCPKKSLLTDGLFKHIASTIQHVDIVAAVTIPFVFSMCQYLSHVHTLCVSFRYHPFDHQCISDGGNGVPVDTLVRRYAAKVFVTIPNCQLTRLRLRMLRVRGKDVDECSHSLSVKLKRSRSVRGFSTDDQAAGHRQYDAEKEPVDLYLNDHLKDIVSEWHYSWNREQGADGRVCQFTQGQHPYKSDEDVDPTCLGTKMRRIH